MHALLEAGLASGEVQPLPVTEFPASRVTDALRHLAAGAHMLATHRYNKSAEGVGLFVHVHYAAFRQGLHWCACAIEHADGPFTSL